MLYVPLNLEKDFSMDTLVVSGAYVGAVAQKEMVAIKQQARANIFENNDPPSFQLQMANDRLEKPLATNTPNFDNGYNTFAEYFVEMKH